MHYNCKLNLIKSNYLLEAQRAIDKKKKIELIELNISPNCIFLQCHLYLKWKVNLKNVEQKMKCFFCSNFCSFLKVQTICVNPEPFKVIENISTLSFRFRVSSFNLSALYNKEEKSNRIFFWLRAWHERKLKLCCQ